MKKSDHWTLLPNAAESEQSDTDSCKSCSTAAPAVSDDDDYGYNETVSDISQLTSVDSEVSNYLADPDRSVAMLNNDTVILSRGRTRRWTNWDAQKKPVIRQQLWKTVAVKGQ